MGGGERSCHHPARLSSKLTSGSMPGARRNIATAWRHICHCRTKRASSLERPALHRSVAERAILDTAWKATVARVTLRACILNLPARAGDLLTSTHHPERNCDICEHTIAKSLCPTSERTDRSIDKFVSWCFKPSQPQRIISGPDRSAAFYCPRNVNKKVCVCVCFPPSIDINVISTCDWGLSTITSENTRITSFTLWFVLQR